MVKRLRTLWIHAGLWLVLAGLPLCAAPAGQAQGSAAFPTEQSRAGKERTHPERLPEKPTLPPVFTIPVDPLGFSAPGAIYLGQRNSLASLDFLDENRLLFTFRVPGLIRREAGDSAWGDERQIRAVVRDHAAGWHRSPSRFAGSGDGAEPLVDDSHALWQAFHDQAAGALLDYRRGAARRGA